MALEFFFYSFSPQVGAYNGHYRVWAINCHNRKFAVYPNRVVATVACMECIERITFALSDPDLSVIRHHLLSLKLVDTSVVRSCSPFPLNTHCD